MRPARDPDFRLMARVSEGDRHAFDEIYRDAENQVSHEASPEDAFGHARLHQLLRGAMADLSPDHRGVVELTYFQDLSYREIAEIMDCPVDTVKTRMFHARRKLKQRLDGELPDWI